MIYAYTLCFGVLFLPDLLVMLFFIANVDCVAFAFSHVVYV